MNFAALQARVAALLELGGYSNTANPANVAALVNQSYREWVGLTRCNWSEDATLVTVSGQALYTLPAPEFVSVSDVLHDSVSLYRVGPTALRRTDPEWLKADAGVPCYWWVERPGVIRLYPKPSTAGKEILVYGPRLPADMTTASSVPMVPEIDHEALCKRAYWYEAERTVRGEERQQLIDQIEQYQRSLVKRQAEFAGARLAGVDRYRSIQSGEIVSV